MAAVEPITGTQGTIPRATPRTNTPAPAGRPPWAQGQHPNLGAPAPKPRPPSTVNRLTQTASPDDSAYDAVLGFLAPYGLQGLATWAWNEYKRLGGGQTALQTIQLELPSQSAYQQRFPAIAAREKAGLPSLTPADYLNYETSLDQELAKVGAPSQLRAGTNQFNQIVTDALTNDVSASELQARIDGGYSALMSSPQEARDWFGQQFGVKGDSALLSYFLAPEHSEQVLGQMEREAQAGGAASRAGIDLSGGLAQQVAQVDQSGSYDSQFAALAKLNPLFHDRAGTSGVSSDTGVEAAFNLDPNATAAVQRELEARAASGAGSGVITSDQAGLTGTGTAR